MILLLDRRFRVALGLCLFASAAALALLPKVFRVSPEGVEPALRISAWDWMQSRALARGARDAERHGDWEAAITGWRLAVANDPGFVAGLRELVDLETRRWNGPTPPNDLWGVEHADWLLRLTETNRVDLDAAVTLSGSIPLDVWTLRLLESREKRNTVQEFEWLKAKLRMGDDQGFRDARAARRYPAALTSELLLYDWAYAAGWQEDDAALLSLLGALENARTRRAAVALCRVVARERRSLDAFRIVIPRLEQFGALDLGLLIDYWEIQAAQGELESVVTALKQNAFPPRNSAQIARLLALYRNVGLEDEVAALLDRLRSEAPASLDVARLVAEELIRAESWKDLEAFAIQFRSAGGGRPESAILSLYLEGLSADAQGLRDAASTAFHRIADHRSAPPEFLEQLALELEDRRYYFPAYAILGQLSEDTFSNAAAYWKQRARLAHHVDDLEGFLGAARRAYDLDSQDLVSAHNYAAALMANDLEPSKALRLTQRVYLRHPDSIPVGINRAKALHQVGRTEEAFDYLNSLDSHRLARQEVAEVGLLTMEILVSRERWGAAVELAGSLQKMALRPSQKRRFADLRQTAQSASYGLW